MLQWECNGYFGVLRREEPQEITFWYNLHSILFPLFFFFLKIFLCYDIWFNFFFFGLTSLLIAFKCRGCFCNATWNSILHAHFFPSYVRISIHEIYVIVSLLYFNFLFFVSLHFCYSCFLSMAVGFFFQCMPIVLTRYHNLFWVNARLYNLLLASIDGK